jgi:DNA (cytosine-5)-methyltransferase 1
VSSYSELIEVIAARPSRPQRLIHLGDPGLLRMDPTEAARHFAVPNPIGRRNMRSGAKKRKQHEIEAQRISLAVTNG